MGRHIDGEIGTQQNQTYGVLSIDLVHQNKPCDLCHVLDHIIPELHCVAVLHFHDRDNICPLKGVRTSILVYLDQASVRLEKPGPKGICQPGTSHRVDGGGASVMPFSSTIHQPLCDLPSTIFHNGLIDPKSSLQHL